MSAISLSFSPSFFFLLLLSCSLNVHSNNSAKSNTREAIEVVIGGGGGGGVVIGIGGGGGGGHNSPGTGSNTPDCPPSQTSPLIFADERLAVVYPVIQKFRNLITSDPLGITDTWVGPDICNKYRGFFCEPPPDNRSATALASIDFNGFQLGAPTIAGFLDQLPDLALFHANTNNFSGTIPSTITSLPYLYELDISNNKFSGAFPSSLLRPNNITFLDLRFNFFAGEVPPEIFTRRLDVLFINNNNFVQTLPATLGNTPVFYLTLANNRFTGDIPRSLGRASATLREVLLLNNKLSGCLPFEIGYLKQLTVFDVANNCLTGPIPCSFGCLEKIEQLNLAGNLFYGQVPEMVCALENVENLTLSDNYFTIVGPICRSLIKKGVLDVRKNCIHGLPFQRPIWECAKFFSVPRFCPFPSSFTFVPCKFAHVWEKRRESGSANRTLTSSFSKMPSPSYAALERHRT